MKILFVSAEVSPFAKVGGLADVAGSLPKALLDLGHDVRIVMPAYRMVEENSHWNVRPVHGAEQFNVEIGPGFAKSAYLAETRLAEVPVYLLGTDEWFTDTVDSTTIYLPGSDQHLFMARGILAAMEQIDWIPDVIHCNDWHTGALPVVLREDSGELWNETASVFTIHNLAYQGEFGPEILERLGLSHGLFNMHQLETFGTFNFLKAGAVYADQVNTVSPQYAQEIQSPEFGCRLEGLMWHLSQEGKLHGILNGIDMEEFNPSTDSHIPAAFSADDPSGKDTCKAEVLRELGLEPQAGVPLMGVVSRLSGQKGMDMMIEKSDEIFSLPAQLIVQGLGDQWLAEKYRELEARYPDKFRFVEKFDADLAQRIYAGSDIFLMPSAFEPCGLGQMIALRYGTIPVVRRTGGLANTVFEGENGFVFENKSAEEFIDACRRAATAYAQAETWRAMVKHALEGDYGWNRSAREYEAMYRRASEARKAVRTRVQARTA